VLLDNLAERRDGIFAGDRFGPTAFISDGRLTAKDMTYVGNWHFNIAAFANLSFAITSQSGPFSSAGSCTRISYSIDSEAFMLARTYCDDYEEDIFTQHIPSGRTLHIKVELAPELGDTMYVSDVAVLGQLTSEVQSAQLVGQLAGQVERALCDLSFVQLDDGCWHHVAMTYHPPTTTLSLYVDGVSAAAAQSSSTAINASAALTIGCNENFDGCFAGAVDEVRVFDQALTHGQVLNVSLDNAPSACPKCGDGILFLGFETAETCPEDVGWVEGVFPSKVQAGTAVQVILLFEASFGYTFEPTSTTLFALTRGGCSIEERILQSRVFPTGAVSISLQHAEPGIYGLCLTAAGRDWWLQNASIEVLASVLAVMPSQVRLTDSSIIATVLSDNSTITNADFRLVPASNQACEFPAVTGKIFNNALSLDASAVSVGTYALCVRRGADSSWIRQPLLTPLRVLAEAEVQIPTAVIDMLFNNITIDSTSGAVSGTSDFTAMTQGGSGYPIVTQGTNGQALFFNGSQGVMLTDNATASFNIAAATGQGVTLAAWVRPTPQRVLMGSNMVFVNLGGIALSFTGEVVMVDGKADLIYLDNFAARRDGLFSHDPFTTNFGVAQGGYLFGGGEGAVHEASWTFGVQGYSALRVEGLVSHLVSPSACVTLRATIDGRQAVTSQACNGLQVTTINMTGLVDGLTMTIDVSLFSGQKENFAQLEEVRVFGKKATVVAPASIQSNVTWGASTSILSTTPALVPEVPSACWQHVATVIDSAARTHVLYINGHPVAEGNLSAAFTAGSLNELGCGAGIVDCFQGALDEVRIFGTALTMGQVASITSSPSVKACPTCGDGVCDVGFETVTSCAVDCLQVQAVAPTAFVAQDRIALVLSLDRGLLGPDLSFGTGVWDAAISDADLQCIGSLDALRVNASGVVDGATFTAGVHQLCLRLDGGAWVPQIAGRSITSVPSLNSLTAAIDGDVFDVAFNGNELLADTPIRLIPLVEIEASCDEFVYATAVDARGRGFLVNVSIPAGSYEICSYVLSTMQWVRQTDPAAILLLRRAAGAIPDAVALLWDMELLGYATDVELGSGLIAEWDSVALKATNRTSIQATQGAVGSTAALFTGSQYIEQTNATATKFAVELSQRQALGMTLAAWVRPQESLRAGIDGQAMFIAQVGGLALAFKEGSSIVSQEKLVFEDNFNERRDGSFTARAFDDLLLIETTTNSKQLAFKGVEEEEISWTFDVQSLDKISIELGFKSTGFGSSSCLRLFATLDNKPEMLLSESCGPSDEAVLAFALKQQPGKDLKVRVVLDPNSALGTYYITTLRVNATPFKVIEALGITGTAVIGEFTSVVKSNPRLFNLLSDEGSWQHVAVTLDLVQKTHRLFINGVVAQSTVFNASVEASNISSAAAKAYVGCTPTEACFEGAIDDVRFYTTPLAANQVAALFQKTKPANLSPLCGDGECSLGFETVLSCFQDCAAFSEIPVLLLRRIL
jgi:hypothetical protein